MRLYASLYASRGHSGSSVNTVNPALRRFHIPLHRRRTSRASRVGTALSLQIPLYHAFTGCLIR